MKFSLGKWLLPTYVTLAFVYLMIPIGYTFVFSFNKVEKSNIAWKEFTFDNWLNMCDQPTVCEAFGNSVSIALISTAVSTALGTAIAIAVPRAVETAVEISAIDTELPNASQTVG